MARTREQVTTLGTFSGTPRWFPDGRRIVFDSQNGRPGRHLRGRHGRRGAAPPDRRPERRRGSQRVGGRQVDPVRVDTNRPLRDLEGAGRGRPGGPGDAAGRLHALRVAGRKDDLLPEVQGPTKSDLWSVPAGGGEERRLVGPLFNFGYAVTGDGIFFIGPGAQGGGLLRFFDFARGTVRRVAEIPGQTRVGLSVSPDRRYALVTKYESVGSDLMLVENFR